MKKIGIVSVMIFAVVLSIFSMSIASAKGTNNNVVQIMGDVNGDGTVSVADVVFVQRILTHGLTPTDDMKKRAMVMGRGDVCLADAVCILRYVSGSPCNENVGKEIQQSTEPSTENTKPKFVVETVKANPNDKNVAVKISVQNNPGLASISLDVNYDDKNLTLTNFTYNTEAVSGASTVPFHTGAYPPCVSVVNGTANITGDWDFVTLYFDVADTAKGVYDISLSYDEDNVYDINENNVSVEVVKGAIEVNNEETTEATTDKEKYTVIFKNYDGSILSQQTVQNGDTAVAPEVPERNGYIFKGWDKSFENIKGNLTVQAVFEKISTAPQFIVSSVSAKPGDKNIAVNVSLKNNPGIASVSLDIIYDKNILTLTDFQYNTAMTQGSSTLPYNASAFLPCLSMINGNSNVCGDGIFATLYFDVSESASGSCPISIRYDEDNVYNIDETNVNFEVTNGFININNN